MKYLLVLSIIIGSCWSTDIPTTESDSYEFEQTSSVRWVYQDHYAYDTVEILFGNMSSSDPCDSELLKLIDFEDDQSREMFDFHCQSYFYEKVPIGGTRYTCPPFVFTLKVDIEFSIDGQFFRNAPRQISE